MLILQMGVGGKKILILNAFLDHLDPMDLFEFTNLGNKKLIMDISLTPEHKLECGGHSQHPPLLRLNSYLWTQQLAERSQS